MALKDTLAHLLVRQEQDERAKQDVARTIEDWKASVTSLINELQTHLSEYERDGSLKFRPTSVSLDEEALGAYQVSALDIIAGPITLEVRPVARMVVGALGRIDIHRQGRPGEDDRIMLLRSYGQAHGASSTWSISLPAPPGTVRGFGVPRSRRSFVQLTKEALEQGLEILLS